MDGAGIFSDVPFPGGYGWILADPRYSIARDSEQFRQPFPAGIRGNRREFTRIGCECFFLDSFSRVPLFSGRFCCWWWIVLVEIGPLPVSFRMDTRGFMMGSAEDTEFPLNDRV